MEEVLLLEDIRSQDENRGSLDMLNQKGSTY
jgi:hypothetical protein